jgi:hypothetical protein
MASSTAPIVLRGESGSGKELLARFVHDQSKCASGILVSTNCSAIPSTLIVSQLFGYERGAFTGAQTSRAGLFEQADGGTLFLDEIGELSAEAQAAMLRVLEDATVMRVGGTSARRVQGNRCVSPVLSQKMNAEHVHAPCFLISSWQCLPASGWVALLLLASCAGTQSDGTDSADAANGARDTTSDARETDTGHRRESTTVVDLETGETKIYGDVPEPEPDLVGECEVRIGHA